MIADSKYALVTEMLETPGILRRFDPAVTGSVARAANTSRGFLLTGEGSSRIFPAKNTIAEAARRGFAKDIRTAGTRQAAEYVLKDFTVVGNSNSGRTRETIALFEKLATAGQARYGITGTAGSKLTEIASESIVLKCGAEKAVPATKSVVEQALICQSLLQGGEWKRRDEAAALAEKILLADVPGDISAALNKAPVIYFCGRDDGVAEELSLKAAEIIRHKSVYLDGTLVLHGIEEVMTAQDAVVLVEPFRDEIEVYQRVLQKGVGAKVIAIASFDTPFPTLRIPTLEAFNGYLQLMAGWNVLVATGLALGLDLDKPKRARKIGNEIS